MTEPRKAINRQTFRRLVKSVGVFLKSPAGGKARWLLAALLILMFAINGMNIANSYVGRYFMSAIEGRDTSGFTRFAWLYAGVFAASTLVGVLFRFTEERLGLLWRDWLTHRITRLYIDHRIYLNMTGADAVSNPDQRMTEDVRQLTTTTLSFLLMILNGTLAAVSFSGVLWTISPKLFMVAVLYALAGSALTIWLGRPLVRLNYQQADREADFRSELIRTGQNADGIAMAGKESEVRDRLMARIDGLVANLRHIIAINRNLGFFTTGYNYLIQLIPVLIVAPLFMRGDVEFGVIGQSTMAFATLLGALSLVITQFQAISSYASVVSRLGEFTEAAEKVSIRSDSSQITVTRDADVFEFVNLTLLSSAGDESPLLSGLNLRLEQGQPVRVFGGGRAGRIALFRAAAGLHERGSGKIIRPPGEDVAFLPEIPYLPTCSLRELLTPDVSASLPDEELLRVLEEIGLESLVQAPEGIDSPRSWQDGLSIHDAKLVAVARALLAKPRFAFTDELESALDESELRLVQELFGRAGITLISFHGPPPPATYQGACLQLHKDGSWSWRVAVPGAGATPAPSEAPGFPADPVPGNH